MGDPQNQNVTIDEIWRVMVRIEGKLDTSNAKIDATNVRLSEHDIAIAVLKDNRSTAMWVINGFWLLVLAVTGAALEYFHK